MILSFGRIQSTQFSNAKDSSRGRSRKFALEFATFTLARCILTSNVIFFFPPYLNLNCQISIKQQGESNLSK